MHSAREGEGPLAGLLGAQARVLQQRDRRLAQAALGGNGDPQAVGEGRPAVRAVR